MAEPDKSREPPPNNSQGLFQTRYREATLSSILYGVLFGIVMNASITYAGLKLGFTIVGSTLAALVGFGVLRGILRKGSILETNIGQTIASSINAATGGIIFTVPVLFLLNQPLTWSEPRFWWITLAGTVGAIIGVAFIVPLRKQMIDIDRLRFPSGTAVAAILKSPGAGPRKAMVLLGGVVIGALIFLPVELQSINKNLPGYQSIDWRLSDPRGDKSEPLPREIDRDRDKQPDLLLTNQTIDVGRLLGMPDYMLFVFAITPLSFGAGYLSGRAGLMVLAGGVLAFLILNPAAYLLGWFPSSVPPDEIPDFARGQFNRPLGIGMLVGGAFMGVLAALPAVRAAFVSLASAGKTRQGNDELKLPTVIIIGLTGIVGLYLAADFVADQEGSGGYLSSLNPHFRSWIIALVGAAWIWFAGIIIAQCTGMTDWSPISGMALLTVVIVMLLAGTDQVIAAVLIGAALCVSLSASSDMMADLKTGYLVGAQPRRQQILELFATGVGPVISMLVLLLIVQANLESSDSTVGIGPGTSTPAPQAAALQKVIEGIQGENMPYALYFTGALLGILLGLGTFSGLGVLIGLSMYLPLEYVLTYGLGCITNIVLSKVKGRTWAEEWGVPFCAGFIVGEALLALVINVIIILKGGG